jgi:inositol-pentakisphosphate 2-kinase
LELISDNEEDRKRAAANVTNDKRLQEYLINSAQPLLHIQRRNQVELDADGILNAKTAEQIMKLCKAMTLRDCTLFLKRSGSHIETRLADLDLKTPGKLARWKKVEQDLVTNGWYTNMEDKTVWKKEKVCLLARHDT